MLCQFFTLMILLCGRYFGIFEPAGGNSTWVEYEYFPVTSGFMVTDRKIRRGHENGVIKDFRIQSLCIKLYL